jgi:uncharacterized protein involved in outer membrane biogenesis
MPITIKTALKIFASLLGLLVIGVLVATVWLANVDPNQHKAWLQAQIHEATGMQVNLNGELDFSLYPWLMLAADDVQVANPPGFDGEVLASIEQFTLRARLLPLLGRNVEIDTLNLRGVNAHLITDAQGNRNWAMGSGEGNEAAADEAQDSGLPFNDLRVGGINIENINILLEDRAADSRLTISELRFSSDDLVYGQPINLDLAFAIAANNPPLDADVALAGTVNYDLDNGRYDIEPLRLAAQLRGNHLPDGQAEVSLATALHFDFAADRFHTDSLLLQAPQTQLQASITATDFQSSNPSIESQLAISGDDVALLFRIAGIEPLASQLAALPERELSLQTTFSAQPGRGSLEVSTLELSLLGATVTGQLSAGNLDSGAPVLRGDLRASGPNLPSVMEVAGQLTGGRDTKLAEGGRLMQGLEDKRFELTAQFDADLQRGNVQLPVFTASLLSSEFSANLAASKLNTDSPAARGQLQASGEDIAMLMQIASWFAMGPDSAAFRYGNNFGFIPERAYSLNTVFDVDLQTGAINVSQLTANALGQRLQGSFSAANINNGNAAVSGALSLNGSDLPALLRALEQAELAEVLQSATVQMQFGGSSNDLAINPARAELTLSGADIPNSPVTLSLDAASRINIQRETLELDNFALAGLGLDVRGRLAVSDLFAVPAVEGAVEIAQFNPRQLLSQLNQPVPETSDPTAMQALALNSAFSFSASGLSLSELALRLDQSNINGNFSVQQNGLTEWQLELDIDSLDVDRYLAEAEPVANSSTTDDIALPVPVELIRSLSGRGSLDIGTLQVAGMTLADLSVNVQAADGRISLSPLSSNLYQGSFNGTMGLDASQPLPSIAVNVALQDIAIDPLLTDMLDAAMVSGIGSVQLDVRSAGADTLALRHGLTGTGSINLEDGILQGVDVASVLNQLETMLRSRSAGQFNRGEQTAFDSFTANLQIDNGVINSNDLMIQSPGFQVIGNGTLLNLHNDSINYNLLTSVTAGTATRNDQEFDVGGYDVPIACSGTIAAPRCLPDAGEIFRTAFANEVRDRVGDLLRRATGTDQVEATAADDDGNTDQPDPAEQLINRALDRLLPN